MNPSASPRLSGSSGRKTFRLFKRSDAGRELPPSAAGFKERPYYFKFTFHGSTYMRCLETTDATEAQRRARLKAAEIRAAITRDDYDRLDKTRLRSTTSTLGEVFAAYRAHPARVPDAATRTANLNALLNLLQFAGITESPDSLSLSRINRDLVRTWKLKKEHQAAAAITQAGAPTPEEHDRHAQILRTANSLLRQARSPFKPTLLEHYELDCKLRIPDTLKEFCAVPGFDHVHKQDYHPPAPEIVTSTLADWEKLEDRNLFLAIGLALSFGLRKGEIAQARRSWLQDGAEYPVCDGRGQFKHNHSGHIRVRALDPYWTILKTVAQNRGWIEFPAERGASLRPAADDADPYLLEGTATDREEGTFRAVSAWLGARGWAMQKKAHALRDYAGSQIAMRWDIYTASGWLRHKSVTVTEQSYSHFIEAFKPADPTKLPVKWAELVRKFEPQIMPAALGQ